MNTCFDVANYFIKRQDPDAGDLMSNMKVQKLVYYAQGFCLAITGMPLFDERIEAWDHGPVCVPLYHEYKQFEAGPIPIPYDVDALSIFSEDIHEILDMVQIYYGQFSAWKLRNLTHGEEPWMKAFAKGRCEISHDDMRNYFKTQLTEDEND
jgi:uncharacterized phage-associated protein